jgi:hypothetical protein
MRAPIGLLAFVITGTLIGWSAQGQVLRSPQDSSHRKQDSLKTVIMTVDSTAKKGGSSTAQQGEAKKPRSSTVRTLERQTASHAAKNAPHVKDAKPTTR